MKGGEFSRNVLKEIFKEYKGLVGSEGRVTDRGKEYMIWK